MKSNLIFKLLYLNFIIRFKDVGNIDCIFYVNDRRSMGVLNTIKPLIYPQLPKTVLQILPVYGIKLRKKIQNNIRHNINNKTLGLDYSLILLKYFWGKYSIDCLQSVVPGSVRYIPLIELKSYMSKTLPKIKSNFPNRFANDSFFSKIVSLEAYVFPEKDIINSFFQSVFDNNFRFCRTRINDCLLATSTLHTIFSDEPEVQDNFFQGTMSFFCQINRTPI